MSIEAVYFDTVLKLCDKTATYAEVYYLRRDLLNDESRPSPGSILTLAKYYEGDMDKLEAKFKRAGTDCNQLYIELAQILNSADEDYGDGKIFCNLLIQPQANCDFRTKVRDWSRAALRRINKGETVPLCTFKGFMERYNALVARRNKKNS